MKTHSTVRAAFLSAAVILTFPMARAADELIAVLTPTKGSDVSGVVTFTEVDGGKVKVTAHIEGLEPNSKHGFHVHEFGDISSDDGKAAGGHYNPEKHEHALPMKEMRHAGDLGNVEANGDGVADYTITVDNMTLTEGDAAIIGRGLIVHAKPDDGGQPTGNAGDRVAQAVIGVKNPGDKK